MAVARNPRSSRRANDHSDIAPIGMILSTSRERSVESPPEKRKALTRESLWRREIMKYNAERP